MDNTQDQHQYDVVGLIAKNTTLSPTTTFRPGLAFSTAGRASSQISSPGLPLALIPLYQIVHEIVLKKAKYDITNVATKVIMVGGAAIGLSFLWDCIKPLALPLFTSSVTVPGDSQLYQDLDQWIPMNAFSIARRHLSLAAIPEGRPATTLKSGWFSYERRVFHFEYVEMSRSKKGFGTLTSLPAGRDSRRNSRRPDQDENPPPQRHEDGIRISTMFSSSDSILQLLEKIEVPIPFSLTTVKVLAEDLESFEPHDRPLRPLSTIDLDEQSKMSLVNDAKKFTDPKRQQYYANRGIPYRRGYLFHGEPGTGKSSMSISLAGLLNRPLYILSMGEIQYDGYLKAAFKIVPSGSIILIEDIDSAGISRENMKKKQAEYVGSRLTLSALLNALDGVCDREGIITIMTTNAPETLDPALIRPGRMDVQVHFSLVTRTMAESIFMRIYQDDEALAKGNDPLDENIKRLAKIFSSKIPENKLSPAEVQTFLTLHDDPGDAIDWVGPWVADQLVAKAAGKNIIEQPRSVTEENTERDEFHDAQDTPT